MKRTLDDQQFGEEFARRLRAYYERAKNSGETEQSFADRLGINRGGLQRYLRENATPSVRTLVHAFREFGICVPYAGMNTKPLVSRRAPRRALPEFQMDLPLTIGVVGGEIDVVELKKRPQSYSIRFQVK